MKSNFLGILEQAINEVNAANGCRSDIKLERCEVVRICNNGAHKSIDSGRFVSKRNG